MPKVTIAIPTYNRQEYLKECLNSILSQSFQDFNILVFDNHSDYDLIKFLEGFKDNRISWVVKEANMGGTENFKSVFLRRYEAPYVVVFHDDDVMHPRMLEREMEVFAAFPQAAMVAAGTNFVHRERDMGKFIRLTGAPDARYLPNKAALCRVILSGFNLCFDSVMYRSEILEDLAPFQSFGKWGDRPYLLHLAAKGGAAILDEKLVNYRVHSGQDSQSNVNMAETVEHSKKLFNFYLNCLPKSLSKADEKLFYGFAANNILNFAGKAGRGYNGFKQIVNSFIRVGLFKLRFVSAKGFFYILKNLLKR